MQKGAVRSKLWGTGLLLPNIEEAIKSGFMILTCLATAKRALTSFSPSPNHLLVKLLELMLIRLLLASAASARASSVFPFPSNNLS